MSAATSLRCQRRASKAQLRSPPPPPRAQPPPCQPRRRCRRHRRAGCTPAPAQAPQRQKCICSRRQRALQGCGPPQRRGGGGCSPRGVRVCARGRRIGCAGFRPVAAAVAATAASIASAGPVAADAHGVADGGHALLGSRLCVVSAHRRPRGMRAGHRVWATMLRGRKGSAAAARQWERRLHGARGAPRPDLCACAHPRRRRRRGSARAGRAEDTLRRRGRKRRGQRGPAKCAGGVPRLRNGYAAVADASSLRIRARTMVRGRPGAGHRAQGQAAERGWCGPRAAARIVYTSRNVGVC
mmetsp:Transcript_42702/g.128165  ORF Transcript_42702/g.128165 Transcript_42702/m.128165 type:complete len:298 (+) Transcript_42702:4823-5716(+)